MLIHNNECMARSHGHWQFNRAAHQHFGHLTKCITHVASSTSLPLGSQAQKEREGGCCINIAVSSPMHLTITSSHACAGSAMWRSPLVRPDDGSGANPVPTVPVCVPVIPGRCARISDGMAVRHVCACRSMHVDKTEQPADSKHRAAPYPTPTGEAYQAETRVHMRDPVGGVSSVSECPGSLG